MSSNGNNVRITGLLCEEFTSHQWIYCAIVSQQMGLSEWFYQGWDKIATISWQHLEIHFLVEILLHFDLDITSIWSHLCNLNTLKTEQNRWQYAHDIFLYTFLNEIV